MGCGSSSDSAINTTANPQAGAAELPGQVNWKPIHSAVRWNKPIDEIDKLLVSEEAVNCVDSNNGNRPIHIAAQNGHFETLQLLVSKKADTNVKNMKGNTPLHMSVGYDYYECAMLLIENGAEREAVNDSGFKAINGIDGDKTLGLAALVCAKTYDDVVAAFDMCEEKIHEVEKASFVAAGMKTKKSIGDAWTPELQERFKGITQKV